MTSSCTMGRRAWHGAAVLASVLAFASIAAPARAADAVSAAELETFLGLGDGAFDGIGGPAFSGSALRTSFTAAAGDVLSFQFNFLTDEDPSPPAPGDLINDFAFITLNGEDPTVLAEVATNSFSGSSTMFSMETGLLTFSTTLGASGLYTMGLGVINVIDELFPSALLLSGFQLNGAAIPGVGVGGGVLTGFDGIGSFSVVDGSFGSPLPGGGSQALVSGTAAVPEPAALISMMIGASGLAAFAARRGLGRRTATSA